MLQQHYGVTIFKIFSFPILLFLYYFRFLVPPDVSASPNQSLTIGHTGILSCNLSGIITKIFWYKNGRYITKWKTGIDLQCSCVEYLFN